MSLTVLSVSYPLAKVSPGTAGGAEQSLLTLDKALVQDGCHSIVIAPFGSRCHGFLIPVQVPSGTLDERAKREARVAFAEAIDETLERFPIDVVHMHGLDFHEYLPSTDTPVVVSLHLPLSWYDQNALRLSGRNTILVCVSRSQAETAPSDVRIDRIIPNGVDVDSFPRAVKRGRSYFLVLGRICPEKAIHVALDAAAAAEEDVIIAGEVYGYAEHLAYFREKVRPRLNAHARFVGSIGGSHKTKLLAGSKALLIPSHAPETSSLVAMEALAAGVPVIAWHSGALPEIVHHGRTGFIVSSASEMCAAMGRVDEIDPKVCQSEARQLFSSRRMFSDFLNLYRDLACARPLPELIAA